MSGWTVVDTATNKSVPVGGTQSSGTPGGAGVAYTTPAPSTVDPVGKLRVSQPQSLIDTDFEYGPQPTKWESIALQNNRATAYYIPQSPLVITSITGQGTSVTPLVLTGTFNIPAGSIIYIQNATDSNANGWGFTAAGGVNTMTVVMSTTSAAGEKFNTAGTYVYLGYFYSGSGFRLGTTSSFGNGAGSSIVTCQTASPHGLSQGSLIFIVGTTSTSTSINGPQIVSSALNTTAFQFININGTIANGNAVTNSIGQTNLYARSAGFVESRPYDGGVAFSASSVGVNQQLIRQTRRYFRYQSGKGIQFSTGTSLCPTLFVTSITNAAQTVTVTTRFPHNLSAGCVVRVQNCNPGGYNGTYTVGTVPNPTQFTYQIGTSLGGVQATGFPMRVSPVNWYGASNRAGMFDQQNGMFFEYDGQQLYAVWRSSVLQLNGTVTVTNGSGTVTGAGTQFTTQLIPGDFIVIRGQTYRVLGVPTDTSLSISPEYRGTTITSPSYAIVSKTVDTRIPQSQWNLDKCNGTGPSGYNIDLTRMQMLYMDYSWYGAGVIRWGVRATNGQVIYCHQQQNNNQQFEAYLRSGNMPAHYESNGIVGYTILNFRQNTFNYYGNYTDGLTAAITAQSTTIPVSTSTYWQTQGGVARITVGSQNEYIYYGGVVGNNLVNCIRGIAGTPRSYQISGTSIAPDAIPVLSADQFNPNGGTVIVTDPNGGTVSRFTYTGIYKNNLYGLGTTATISTPFNCLQGVEFAAPDTAAPLAHWGSSVIMDGLFDDDKSLVFNYGTTSTISLNAGTTVPIMAIRVAPTADNGTTGLLGIKETINRMQLQLSDMAVVSSGTILVNLVLNGTCTGFSGSFQSIAASGQISSSLAQVAVNTSNTATITSGESVTALYSNGVNTLDLGQVRDLGNSILGGGTVNTIPTTPAGVYPDGPDILYVVATNTTASAVTMLARINWKEAQA
jgi:hypothetical protein